MNVKIKRLHPGAKLPKKAHKSDFCYDVWAASEEEIAPNVWKYNLGFALQIDRWPWSENIEENERIFSIDVRPRSSVWKTGMVLSNCVGTIDEGYTGEISMVFYHVVPSLPRYKVGDRIGQIKIGETVEIEFEETDILSQTERGTGGYGSTGTK